MEEKNAEKKEAAGLMDHLFFLFVINDPIDLALFFFPLLCERALARHVIARLKRCLVDRADGYFALVVFLC